MEQFNICEWRVIPSRNLVIYKQSQLQLEPKVMAVLCYLAKHEGQVCSRDLIMDSVWSNVIVGDEVLTRAISKLRGLLKDTKRPYKIIETIPKRGYRLAINTSNSSIKKQHKDSYSQGFRHNIESQAEISQSTNIDSLMDLRSLTAKLNVFSTRYFSERIKVIISLTICLVTFIFVTLTLNDNFDLYEKSETRPHLASWQRLSKATEGILGVDTSPVNQKAVVAQQVTLSKKNTFGEKKEVKISKLFISDKQNIMQPIQELVTSTSSKFSDPTWSHSGKKVAYISRTKSRCNIVTYEVESQIEKTVGWCLNARHLAWNPEDNKLIYSDIRNDRTSSHIFLLDLSTNTVEQLTKPNKESWGDFNPLFTADGQSIIFYRPSLSYKSGVFQLHIGHKTARQLIHSPEYINGLTLNGKNHILYSTYHGHYYKIWQYDLTTNDHPTIVSEGVGTLKIWATKNKNRFIFSKINYDLNLYDFPTSNFKNLQPLDYINSNHSESKAQLSPDNQWLAFISTRTGHSQLWLKKEDDEPIQVTFSKGYFIGLPVWSPDSEYVYLTFKAFGKSTTLFRYHIKSNGLEQISTDNADYETPLALNDNELLVSSNRDGDWKIWHLNITDGQIKIYRDVAVSSIKKAPSKKGILYVKRYVSGLWYQEDIDAPEKLLITGFNQVQDAHNWFSGTHGVYLSRRMQGTEPVMQYYDWKAREVKTIGYLGKLKTNSGIAYNSSNNTLIRTQVSSSNTRLISAELTKPIVNENRQPELGLKGT